MPDWIALGPAPWLLAIAIGVLLLARHEARVARRVREATRGPRWDEHRDERACAARLHGRTGNVTPSARRRPS